MKLSLSTVVIAIVTSVSAHASLNSDAVEKSVRCDGPQIKVVINKDRTVITIVDLVGLGQTTQYGVDKVRVNSDGDTFVSYSGTVISPDPDVEVTFSFYPNGNTLTYRLLGYEAQSPIQLFNCK